MFKKHNVKEIKEVEHQETGDICDDCHIACKVVLGNNVHVARNVTFIGKGTIYVGNNTTIAPGVVIYTSYPNLKTGATNKYVQGHQPIIGDVKIGTNVFIGSNSVIGAGVEIEDDSIIYPVENIKPNTIFKRKYKWRQK